MPTVRSFAMTFSSQLDTGKALAGLRQAPAILWTTMVPAMLPQPIASVLFLTATSSAVTTWSTARLRVSGTHRLTCEWGELVIVTCKNRVLETTDGLPCSCEHVDGVRRKASFPDYPSAS